MAVSGRLAGLYETIHQLAQINKLAAMRGNFVIDAACL